jgi:hypothetical protein
VGSRTDWEDHDKIIIDKIMGRSFLKNQAVVVPPAYPPWRKNDFVTHDFVTLFLDTALPS